MFFGSEQLEGALAILLGALEESIDLAEEATSHRCQRRAVAVDISRVLVRPDLLMMLMLLRLRRRDRIQPAAVVKPHWDVPIIVFRKKTLGLLNATYLIDATFAHSASCRVWPKQTVLTWDMPTAVCRQDQSYVFLSENSPPASGIQCKVPVKVSLRRGDRPTGTASSRCSRG